MFQSPRSGQICLNAVQKLDKSLADLFQSPRSGQICLNWLLVFIFLPTILVSIP